MLQTLWALNFFIHPRETIQLFLGLPLHYKYHNNPKFTWIRTYIGYVEMFKATNIIFLNMWFLPTLKLDIIDHWHLVFFINEICFQSFKKYNLCSSCSLFVYTPITNQDLWWGYYFKKLSCCAQKSSNVTKCSMTMKNIVIKLQMF